jgi:hypothetical protein
MSQLRSHAGWRLSLPGVTTQSDAACCTRRCLSLRRGTAFNAHRLTDRLEHSPSEAAAPMGWRKLFCPVNFPRGCGASKFWAGTKGHWCLFLGSVVYAVPGKSSGGFVPERWQRLSRCDGIVVHLVSSLIGWSEYWRLLLLLHQLADTSEDMQDRQFEV